MKCHVCGTSMIRVVSELPFRVNRSVMIILRDLPLMECTECGAYAFEETVMERVHEIVERLDSPSHLDAVLYPADALKGFIRFMRYGVKSPSLEDTSHEGLQAFREAALESCMRGAENVEGRGA